MLASENNQHNNHCLAQYVSQREVQVRVKNSFIIQSFAANHANHASMSLTHYGSKLFSDHINQPGPRRGCLPKHRGHFLWVWDNKQMVSQPNWETALENGGKGPTFRKICQYCKNGKCQVMSGQVKSWHVRACQIFNACRILFVFIICDRVFYVSDFETLFASLDKGFKGPFYLKENNKYVFHMEKDQLYRPNIKGN